ncbi:MAG: ABC transporter permease [Vulcanimicrobiota bacterium]
MTLLLTFKVALKALTRNKLRTILTMLGIIIGVAAVVAMLSIGAGAQAAVEANLTSLGVNTIELSPGYRRGRQRGVEGNSVQMTVADWRALERLPGVESSFPLRTSSAQLVYGSANWNCGVRGTTNEFFTIQNWDISRGRVFTDSEVNSGSMVCVLGLKPATELFGGTDPVGETIRIKGFPFRVVGVLAEKGGSGWSNRDDIVIVPYVTLLGRLVGEVHISSVTLQAHSKDEVEELGQQAVDLLNQRHRIENPKEGGFESYNQAANASVVGDSTRIFSTLLGGVASVSLLVGGIGIMNIMLVSVTERVREIGIRMAVGARGQDILTQFLTEAVLISIAGGAVGLLLGAGIAHWVAGLAGWPTIISESSVLLAFGTSAFVGIFFGFYPAFRASKLDPIEALRK